MVVVVMSAAAHVGAELALEAGVDVVRADEAVDGGGEGAGARAALWVRGDAETGSAGGRRGGDLAGAAFGAVVGFCLVFRVSVTCALSLIS